VQNGLQWIKAFSTACNGINFSKGKSVNNKLK